MANRETEIYRTSVQQVARNPSGVQEALATVGQKLIAEGQEAKITENFSKAQLDIHKLNQEYQISNESNPFAGMEDLKQKRDDIFASYGEEISPFFRKGWQDSTRSLAVKDDMTMEAWAYSQTKKNTVTSINTSIKNNMSQATLDGQNFGNSDQDEVGTLLNYAESKKQLAGFGDKHLGAMETTKILEGYDKDYLKSFVAGVAHSNPKKAAALLEKDEFKKSLTPDDISEFENVIKKQMKTNNLQSLFKQMEAEDGLTDLVTSQEGSYYEKRLQVDQMEFSGAVSQSAAAKARRVLTSQQSVDAMTSSDDMAEIITQIYDLNAIQDTNSSDYLTGVQNVREDILKRQGEGKLRSDDAQKLNAQLRTLTAQKVSDATQNVAMGFYDSNKKFSSLPPQYRGQATRQLFYKTAGQENLSKENYNAYANQIVDQIRKDIRADVVKRLDKLDMTDDDFMKSINATMQDVQDTAKKYGITEKEVIQKMRAK